MTAPSPVSSNVLMSLAFTVCIPVNFLAFCTNENCLLNSAYSLLGFILPNAPSFQTPLASHFQRLQNHMGRYSHHSELTPGTIFCIRCFLITRTKYLTPETERRDCLFVHLFALGSQLHWVQSMGSWFKGRKCVVEESSWTYGSQEAKERTVGTRTRTYPSGHTLVSYLLQQGPIS